MVSGTTSRSLLSSLSYYCKEYIFIDLLAGPDPDYVPGDSCFVTPFKQSNGQLNYRAMPTCCGSLFIFEGKQ
jgi:hypothetical protein